MLFNTDTVMGFTTLISRLTDENKKSGIRAFKRVTKYAVFYIE